MVGDPVLDFVGLIGVAGRSFVNQVLACYDLPLGEGFHIKLDWLCRMLTLTWLEEAVTYFPETVDKQLAWVGRALAD